MSFGQIVQIAECLVVIYCGIKLSVGNEPMRWNKKWVKGLYIILVSMEAGLQVANTFYYKFSEIGIVIHSVYIFIILYMFYYINFWKLFAQNFLFWYTYSLLRFLIICIGCFSKKVLVYRYLENTYGEPWQILHIISMIVTIAIVLWLQQKRHGDVLINCKSRRSYITIAVFASLEEVILFLLFNEDVLLASISNAHVFLIILVLWSLFCGILLIVVLKALFDESHQKQILELNYTHLKRYYVQLKEMYEEKRNEMRDVEQSNDMLIAMLKDNKIIEVTQYLNDEKQIAIAGQKNKFTGIDIIDLILDCKIREAKQYKIDVVVDIDAFFCPLEEIDMCVVLGNLLDNAIDATKELPLEMRIIRVRVMTPNSVFILEISNRYAGERKKVDGYYRTTKKNRGVHGLGIESVEWIMNQYGGWLDLKDEKNCFVAVVSMFLNQGQNSKEKGQF